MPANLQSATGNRKSSRAIFLDRDGTLNQDIGYVSTPGQLILYAWSGEAVRRINRAGLKAIVITNQSGVARGMYTEQTLADIHERMVHELARQGARIDATYYCPHHPDAGCDCRKPRTGMLEIGAREHDIDLSRSFVIGDKASDINLAVNAGAHGALVLSGYGRETLAQPGRWPCAPAIVAENLLEAVERILDTEIIHS